MEQLRQAVRQSGVSMNALSKRTGLPYGVVHGMMKSGKSITVVTLERIAAALELDVTIRLKTDPENKA